MVDSRRINVYVDSLASLWQSKYHQILLLFGWEVSRLSCILGKHINSNFHNSSDSAQVMAGLSPCLDKTWMYKICGKCATQYFIYLNFMRTIEISCSKNKTSTVLMSVHHIRHISAMQSKQHWDGPPSQRKWWDAMQLEQYKDTATKPTKIKRKLLHTSPT